MHELQHPDEPSEKAPEPTAPPRAPRPRWRRASLALLALVVAVVSGAFVTFFTVDLGPSLRQLAEREGSKFIQRPMRIGRLSAKITPGVFVVEDLLFEGLQSADRPFLKAKKIEVVLPWWTIFRRELILESVEIPVIIDAGVGTASDAAIAMELGATAVLMNTGIALAKDPIKMATAMRLAVESGRLAYEAGRMPKRLHAQASSPEDGRIDV